MSKFTIYFLFIGSFSILGGWNTLQAQCNYELAIWDSWGDGFDGSRVEITVNGNAAPGSPLTFTSGSGPETLTVSVNDGDAIVVTYVDNGCCNNEHGWQLTNSVGTVVGSDGTPIATATDGLQTNPGPVPSSTPSNFTASCPSCSPPAGTGSLATNCPSGFSVDVNVTALGDGSPSITDGSSTWPVSMTGITQVGAFSDGASVNLTLQHGSNADCNVNLGTFTYTCPTPSSVCIAAVGLTPGSQQCGDSAGQSGDFDDGGGAPNNPCNSSYNDDEYWFSYTPTQTGDILNLAVSGLSDTYAGIFVLSDCPANSPSCLFSDTNGNSTADLSITDIVLTAGTPIYIVIANWGAPNSTAFCLDATVTAAPSPPNCATTPSPADGATNVTVSGGEVNISWVAPATGDAPTSYDVYRGTTSGNLTLLGNIASTSAIFSGLDFSTTYYWQVVPKNSSGSATGCPEWSFTTAAPAPSSVCIAAVGLTPGSQQCGDSAGQSGDFDDGGGAPNNPCSSSYNDDEYWFSYTPTQTGEVLNLTVSGLSNTYAGIFALSDCPANSPSCLFSATNGNSTADLSLEVTGLTASSPIYIVIANWGAPDNTAFCLDATVLDPQSPPNCATTPSPADGATDVAIPGTSATISWVAPTTGDAPTSYEVFIGTISGSLSSLGIRTDTEFPLTGFSYSTTYYWQVVPMNSGGSATGCPEWSFTTQADPFTPITGGETCATAQTITPGDYTSDGPSTGNGASNSCLNTGATHADWYAFTPTENGFIDVSSCNGGADTELAIYDECDGTCVASATDVCDLGDGFDYAAEVTGVEVCQGTTYLIEWDNDYSSSSFRFTLTFTAGATTCPPPNNACNTPTVSSNFNTPVGGTTTNATDMGDALSCEGTSIAAGVWHIFNYDNAQGLPNIATIDIGNTGHTVHVYTGSCGNLTCVTPVGGGQGTSMIQFIATNNFSDGGSGNRFAQDYYVFVQGVGAYNITPQSVLPVELNYFVGQELEKGNRLRWETASELNTESHIIERSANGRDAWVKVGSLAAAGTSDEARQYELIDENPLPLSYYRLKSVDFDGSTDMSETVVIERKEAVAIIAYPVPTVGKVNIQFQSPVTQSVDVELMTVTGQVIKTIRTAAVRGINTTDIDLADLADGVYFLAIDNGEQRMITRLVKQ